MSIRTTLGGLTAATFLASGCFVPKDRLDKQRLETDTCYQALQQENERKHQLAAAVADLQTALDELAAEHKKMAAEKGSLEDSLSGLQTAVSAKMTEISRLAAEKSKLEAERNELKEKTATYDELVRTLNEEVRNKLIEVTRHGQRITVNVSDRVLFDSGSADVKTSGKEALTKIAKVLAGVSDRRIDVEGHTDNVPVGGELVERFPTNWELSAARATNVVRFLEEQGVDPAHMAAVGKASYRPVAGNKSPAGRQRNRRIEIVLTPWDGK